jgi:hypothetical protein
MILEYLAPGARRRTSTAGTTEASLLGLLDVGNHLIRVQKRNFEVNAAIAGVLSNRDGDGGRPILAVNWNARGRIEPPIWALQRAARAFLRTGDADLFKALKRGEDRCLAS